MSLRIALTGVHSTGKTTLLAAMQQMPEFATVQFLPEITRLIALKGFDINENGTVDTQLLVLSTHIQNFLYHDRFVVDRSILDGYAYTAYLAARGKIPVWVEDYARNLLREFMPRYDLLFYLPPEIPIANDGVRSTDPVFRDEVSRIFEAELMNYTDDNIVVLTGSVEERVQQIRHAFTQRSVL